MKCYCFARKTRLNWRMWKIDVLPPEFWRRKYRFCKIWLVWFSNMQLEDSNNFVLFDWPRISKFKHPDTTKRSVYHEWQKRADTQANNLKNFSLFPCLQQINFQPIKFQQMLHTSRTEPMKRLMISTFPVRPWDFTILIRPHKPNSPGYSFPWRAGFLSLRYKKIAFDSSSHSFATVQRGIEWKRTVNRHCRLYPCDTFKRLSHKL